MENRNRRTDLHVLRVCASPEKILPVSDSYTSCETCSRSGSPFSLLVFVAPRKKSDSETIIGAIVMISCFASVRESYLPHIWRWISAEVPDGFILENNRYDCLPLDDFFSGKQINENSKKSLEKSGYLG